LRATPSNARDQRRQRAERGGRRQPLIHFLRKQALAGAPNDTGPTSRLPETVPLQNKNGSFMEMKPTGLQEEVGRKPDSARRSSLAAFLQQPDGGPIMCGEVHHRGDSRASPQRADRTQQSSGKNDPNIASMLGRPSEAIHMVYPPQRGPCEHHASNWSALS
jgi:hypothetical protein